MNKHSNSKQTTAKYKLSFAFYLLDWEKIQHRMMVKDFMDDDPFVTGFKSSDGKIVHLEFYSNFKEDVDFVVSILPNTAKYYIEERV